MKFSAALLLLSVSMPMLAGGPCAQSSQPLPGASSETGRQLEDEPLAEYRRELLRIAFRAASKFPANPHHKNRGLAQEKVVVACFELAQPKLALSLAPRVEGWRRGVAYADYAWECAKAGLAERAERHLDLAKGVAGELMATPHAQQWRLDRIRLKMSRVWTALQQPARAAELRDQIASTSSGAVDPDWSRALVSSAPSRAPNAAREEVRRIIDTWDSRPLGDRYTSLMLLASLHGAMFAKAALREQIETHAFSEFLQMPANLRLDAMACLARNYLTADDADGARNVLVRMTEQAMTTPWRAEDRMPQMARLVRLRAEVGDRGRAEAELEKLLTQYNEQRDGIVSIYRCETLRPLALACHALGDLSQADALMQTALEEAVENPNSRPRCFDLVESCIELAKHDMEPSAELRRRIIEIADGLGAPW